MKDRYESPLCSRYASQDMIQLFSPQTRITTWRRLWTELARAQYTLGLPISADQVAELEAHQSDIDFAVAEQREKVVHHDVMAHIYAYGLVAPTAAPIIHLGATSCYVTDNADLVIYRTALQHIRGELVTAIEALCRFALATKDIATLGYTHFQPAQPVTIGKRACLWLQDFVSDLTHLDRVLADMRFLGCRGTTGTEASFVELFGGDTAKIDHMNDLIAQAFGFERCFAVCGQTYPRKADMDIMAVLCGISQSAYRMANDIRLLQHDRFVEEPFENEQVGSSAMAYKQNPILCERICSLARYLQTISQNATLTASVQWLERSLDDSANRRISLPEGFLCADSILSLSAHIVAGLRVHECVIHKALMDYLPFVATENILMEGVKRGGNRQELHEIIRRCSVEATAAQKEGRDYDLLGALAAHPQFGMSKEEMSASLDPRRYVGRCVEQVTTFVGDVQGLLNAKN